MGEDTERLSARLRLLECARLNDVDGAKQLGLGRSREERAAAARRQIDLPCMDETLLSKAIECGSVSFVSFLLDECAADVNAVDRYGDTALQKAVSSGHLPVVRLLIEHGGDPSICNRYGDDVLQFAALFARKPDADVLEYLIEEVEPSAQRRADLYALVAAAFVLDKEDEDHALPFWIKSFNVQMAEQTEDSVKVGAETPNLACITPVEGRDVASLAGNIDAMLMQSLTVHERIFGPHHYKTQNALRTCARHYDDMHAHQRRVDLSKHALRKYPWNIWYKLWDSAAEYVRLVDALDMLEILAARMTSAAVDVSTTEKQQVLHFSIDLVYLACRLMTTEAEKSSVQQTVRALVQTRYRTEDDRRTLLHVATFRVHLSSAVVECLLKAGAPVNAADASGNTPLHAVLSKPPEESSPSRAVWLKVIDLLLEYGAHVDIANAKREIAADKMPPSVDVFNHVSLQCLSARAIRKHQLPHAYRRVLPTMLADFVDRH